MIPPGRRGRHSTFNRVRDYALFESGQAILWIGLGFIALGYGILRVPSNGYCYYPYLALPAVYLASEFNEWVPGAVARSAFLACLVAGHFGFLGDGSRPGDPSHVRISKPWRMVSGQQ